MLSDAKRFFFDATRKKIDNFEDIQMNRNLLRISSVSVDRRTVSIDSSNVSTDSSTDLHVKNTRYFPDHAL